MTNTELDQRWYDMRTNEEVADSYVVEEDATGRCVWISSAMDSKAAHEMADGMNERDEDGKIVNSDEHVAYVSHTYRPASPPRYNGPALGSPEDV